MDTIRLLHGAASVHVLHFPAPCLIFPHPGIAFRRTQWQTHRDIAERAVEALGTNAVPNLRRMLRKRDWPLQKAIRRTPLGQWLATKPFFGELLQPADTERNAAACALGLLGPLAKDATLDLIDVLQNCPRSRDQGAICICLKNIGPDAAAALQWGHIATFNI